MKRISTYTSMLVAAVLLPMAAVAEEKLSKVPDQEFFDKAAVSGMFEVQSSELAVQRGTDAQVKSFAQMMVTDHSAANAKLKALALAKGVMLPAELDKDHRKNLDKLKAAKPGKDFDETYADLMEDGHDKAVKLFAKAADGAKDPDVRKFAGETLPTLRMHNEHAEKLDDKNKAP
jgi:putative membrane protein